jgi:glycopeptide antibiotics resistance protein
VILASCVAGGLIGFGVFKIIQRFFYKEILAEDFD